MRLETKNFGYSMKNIPIPNEDDYLRGLIEKIGSLLRRMRNKVKFFDNRDVLRCKNKETYGFKSNYTAPSDPLLKPFEDDLVSMVRHIKFKHIEDPFLNQLRDDVRGIKSSEKLIVFADKTTNLYSVEKEDYNKILTERITKSYKKSKMDVVTEINREASQIASRLEIADRMEKFTDKNAYLTFKDHKKDFKRKLQCRLINPAKTQMGMVSKKILENINKIIRSEQNLLQWKNTKSVIDWFNGIMDKQSCQFIKFDVEEFYPSITEKLLKKCLEFAKTKTIVTTEESEIILHARKSLLFNGDDVWVRKTKKGTAQLFDTTMGSYDGAEVCELVGLFMLDKMKDSVGLQSVGLYRDDGLGILRDVSGPRAEQIRKKLHEIFKNEDLSITIDPISSNADFLDVTFELETGIFYPYRKPNDTPLYINKKSNHPIKIIKQLPSMINRRISDISCNEKEFKKALPIYKDALEKSGFEPEFNYEESRTKRRRRPRKIIWFNPPFSKNVTTNVGKVFLKLIDKHFPPSHKLRPLFNRNNLKISYSCMSNIGNIIKAHNINVLHPKTAPSFKCNCSKDKKTDCPMNGRCLEKCIVYKATVTDDQTSKFYYGTSEGEFKYRFNNHTKSLRNERYKNDTELSKYCWKLKEEKKNFEIKWSIAARAQPYKNGNKICNLCLNERLLIARSDEEHMLNKRNEILGKCRHKNKFSMNQALSDILNAHK